MSAGNHRSVSECIAAVAIRLLGRLVPSEARETWRREWLAELTYAMRGFRGSTWMRWSVTRRIAGAAAHAWWLWRQEYRMTALWSDVRFGMRLLRSQPGLTFAATITLALAIGANAAVYSVMQAAILRPIPIRDPERVVVAWQTTAATSRLNAVFSYPDYRDWVSVAHAVDRPVLISRENATARGAGEAERIQAATVSSGFFEMLGVPVTGRTFTAQGEAAGAEKVIIVTESFRRRHLAAVETPLGTSISFNAAPRRIVGLIEVDPLDGVFGPGVDAWIPLVQRPQLDNRGNRNFTALARLKPGASAADAERELVSLMRRLEDEYPQTNRGRSARVIGLVDEMASASKSGLLLAFAAAGVLLVVACVNIASMMLARNVDRSREFATRTALGATRSRLVGQIVIESLLTASIGTAGGLVLFVICAPALASRLPASVPRASSIGWDTGMFVFGAAIAVLAAVLSGLPAAWRIARVQPIGTQQSAASTGARTALVGLQLASACVLLVVAGLLVSSFLRLQRIDAGFDTGRTATMQMLLRGGARYDSPAKVLGFVDRLLKDVEAQPGVERAAVLSPTPFTGNINRWDVSTDANVAVFKSDRYQATPGVFDVLRLPIAQGRGFSASDSTGVAIVDEVFAEHAFPGLSPLNRRFRLDQNDSLTVIGVVPHIKHYGLDENARPQVYVPSAAEPSDWINLLVRGGSDAASIATGAQRVVRSLDPGIAPFDAATLSDLVRRSYGDRRLATTLALTLAFITIIVAAAGLYGTMAFLVARRSREFGLRLALGARPDSIVRLVLGTAVRVVSIGALLGIPAAAGATRLVHSLLFDTHPMDLRVHVTVLSVLAAVTVVAAILPARRAASIDPVIALRSE